MVAVVSLRDQKLALHGRDGVVATTKVSTGTSSHPTPAGIFSVLEKRKEHYSNIYGGASMPNMQRLTWSGVALHAGYVTGQPASHGCIRLPAAFATELFAMSRVNMRVIVAPTAVAPVDISHANLFVPMRSIADEAAAPAPDTNPTVTRISAPSGSGAMAAPAEEKIVAGEAGTVSPARREAAAADAAERTRMLASDRRNAAEKARAATKQSDEIRRGAGPQLAAVARLGKATTAAEKAARSAERAAQAATRAYDAATQPQARDRLERVKAAAETRHALAQSQLANAKTAEDSRRRDFAEDLDLVKQADDEKTAAVEAYRELVRIGEPVSVFISAKTGLLQVRQAFDQIYETQVTIADRERPLGTHVFTALDVKSSESAGAGTARWVVTSIAAAAPEPPRDARSGRSDRSGSRRNEPAVAAAPTVAPATAAQALDRIQMPKEAIARISALLVPGSSLIVSDEGPSIETGKGTDFIILTR